MITIKCLIRKLMDDPNNYFDLLEINVFNNLQKNNSSKRTLTHSNRLLNVLNAIKF